MAKKGEGGVRGGEQGWRRRGEGEEQGRGERGEERAEKGGANKGEERVRKRVCRGEVLSGVCVMRGCVMRWYFICESVKRRIVI